MRRSAWAVAIVALFTVSGSGLADQKAKPAPALPGITAKDPFPNGCVSCHVITPDHRDMRLGPLLKTLKHRNVDAVVKIVPNDCGKCHRAGTEKGLEKQFHKMHFGKKEKSVFVTEFGGQCLNCHALDPTTGKMTVKSGPRNW